MAKHNNTSISEDAARILNTKMTDTLNNEIAQLTPVINIQPRCNIVLTDAAVNATSQTIYTTPTDKDFYLTSAAISVFKDATSTSTFSRITLTIDGVSRSILQIMSLSLTAQSDTNSMVFPIPIKVDRGTAIAVTNTTNVANIRTAVTIVGYTIETTKGV